MVNVEPHIKLPSPPKKQKSTAPQKKIGIFRRRYPDFGPAVSQDLPLVGGDLLSSHSPTEETAGALIGINDHFNASAPIHFWQTTYKKTSKKHMISTAFGIDIFYRIFVFRITTWNWG